MRFKAGLTAPFCASLTGLHTQIGRKLLGKLECDGSDGRTAKSW
jgi:hypothetical protein